MKYIVAICRILVGVLFIISGLIKANDPIGFSYKLQEYFEVFGMEFFVPFALTLSVSDHVTGSTCSSNHQQQEHRWFWYHRSTLQH
jgi:uncharacterized membrane protein YphA (DoxX/SURF4 family)